MGRDVVPGDRVAARTRRLPRTTDGSASHPDRATHTPLRLVIGAEPSLSDDTVSVMSRTSATLRANRHRRRNVVAASFIQPLDAGTVRDRLIRAADAEIVESGTNALHMDSVAARAGVSRASAFRQLGNVGELLVQVALLRARRHTAA